MVIWVTAGFLSLWSSQAVLVWNIKQCHVQSSFFLLLMLSLKFNTVLTTSTCFELLLVQTADWIAVMSGGASVLNHFAGLYSSWCYVLRLYILFSDAYTLTHIILLFSTAAILFTKKPWHFVLLYIKPAFLQNSLQRKKNNHFDEIFKEWWKTFIHKTAEVIEALVLGYPGRTGKHGWQGHLEYPNDAAIWLQITARRWMDWKSI